jgi:hypothetical protein
VDLPRLGLKRTEQQDRAITALHDFVYSMNLLAHEEMDDEYDSRLDELLHELLKFLFYQKLCLSNMIGCPTDMALVLACLNPDGAFAKTSLVSFMCAVLQYFVKNTCVHTLQLYSEGQSHYVSFTIGRIGEDDLILPDNDSSFMR